MQTFAVKLRPSVLRRAIEGYIVDVPKKGRAEIDGLGGAFRYCTLAEPLFDEGGNIGGRVSFPDLASHVFFTETGAPIPKRANGRNALLGVHCGKAVYLLFNGVLGDKRPNGGNVLTPRSASGVARTRGAESDLRRRLSDGIDTIET